MDFGLRSGNKRPQFFVPGGIQQHYSRRFAGNGIARASTFKFGDFDRQIDEQASAAWDRLIAAYERGLEAARREFGQ